MIKPAVFFSMMAGVCLSDSRAAITVTKGDFEDGLTDQQNNVLGWYERSTATDFIDWTNASTSIFNDPGDGYTQSRHLAMRGDGYVYQSLGTYDSVAGTVLNWNLYQGVFSDGNASAGFGISFYAGPFAGAAEGVNIAAAGLTQIGTTVSLTALGAGFSSTTGPAAGGNRSGTLDLSALANGTEVWVQIKGTGGAGVYAPIDNFTVAQIPESTTALLGLLGLTGLLIKRRR